MVWFTRVTPMATMLLLLGGFHLQTPPPHEDIVKAIVGQILHDFVSSR